MNLFQNSRNSLETILKFLCFLVSAAERKEREDSQHPVYLVKLQNADLITDSTASLMLHVKGNPNPEVKL